MDNKSYPFSSIQWTLNHTVPVIVLCCIEDPKEIRNLRGPVMAVRGYLETGSKSGAPERGQMKPLLPLTSNLAGEAEAALSAGGEWEQPGQLLEESENSTPQPRGGPRASV